MTSRSYEHVLGFALSHPWNLEPAMLSVIAGVLARRIAGLDVDQAAIEAALVNRKNLPQPRAGSVAIIPDLRRARAAHEPDVSDMSGGTTLREADRPAPRGRRGQDGQDDRARHRLAGRQRRRQRRVRRAR